MSKAIKKVASIALPIIGTIVAPGIGTALGSALSGTALGAIGGAIGGGLGGLVNGGGLKGAAIGAVTGGLGGYGGGALSGGLSAGATSLGSAATTQGLLNAGTGAVQGFSTAVRSGIGSSLASGLTSALTSPRTLMGIGNQLIADSEQDAIEKAQRQQQEALQTAINTQQSNTAPYRQLGSDAVNRINEIQSDRAGYIQNNEFYNTLADDAEQRLLANQAAKGKVGSGGTAAALQQELLHLGNRLADQEISQLTNQASLGANAAVGAANNVSNLQVQQGNSQAAGTIGANNAQTSGYQNQINTLLALQGLNNNTPTYQPALFNL